LSPDALHIGFSKCASTFLQAYFEGHPEIFLVNQSHYIAPFSFSEYPDGKDRYLQLFDGAGSDQVSIESDEHMVLPLFHPVLGVAGTTLESVREMCARIKSLSPAGKIVMVVRNQVGLLVSRYSEYVLCGGSGSMDEYVSEILQSSADGTNYYQNFYAQILDILQLEFGQANVLLLLQEDLAVNEAATIAALSEFLGVEPTRPGDRDMISRRTGLSKLGIRVVRGLNKLVVKRPKQSYKEAEVRIPFLVYKVIQRLLRVADYYLPVAIKGDKSGVLSKDAERQIEDMFRDDNRRLSDLLGRDLAALGYR